MNTIGVVYICTGRYRMFWENFISSAERFFLPSYLKRYFVFTDSLNLRDPQGETYYQGCLFGGRSEEFLNLCEVLQRRVQQDLNNGLVATWHDESHLNRFFVSTVPLTLNPGYASPEAVRIPFEKKIVQLDKARFGGHAFLRASRILRKRILLAPKQKTLPEHCADYGHR